MPNPTTRIDSSQMRDINHGLSDIAKALRENTKAVNVQTQMMQKLASAWAESKASDVRKVLSDLNLKQDNVAIDKEESNGPAEQV